MSPDRQARRWSRDSFCSYCGHSFRKGQGYPKACGECGNVTYRNPTPVAVVLLPVDEGILTIRRGIQPQRGLLALPGGYIDWGETWQQEAARELLEETSIRISTEEIALFSVRSTSAGHIIIFAIASPRKSEELPRFEPNHETMERVVLYRPERLAFELHTEAINSFFAMRNR